MDERKPDLRESGGPAFLHISEAVPGECPRQYEPCSFLPTGRGVGDLRAWQSFRKTKGGEEPERKGIQERAGASLRDRPVFRIDLLPGAGDEDGAGAGGSGIYQKRRTDRDAMPRARQIRTHADGGRDGDAREKAAHARGMDTASVHAGAAGRAGTGRKAMERDAHIGGVRKDLRARRSLRTPPMCASRSIAFRPVPARPAAPACTEAVSIPRA